MNLPTPPDSASSSSAGYASVGPDAYVSRDTHRGFVRTMKAHELREDEVDDTKPLSQDRLNQTCPPGLSGCYMRQRHSVRTGPKESLKKVTWDKLSISLGLFIQLKSLLVRRAPV